MILKSLDTGYFKLDGGAMFGVVPKSLWNKRNPADDNNMCTWALRCLLIEDEDRLIVIDSGMGDKQDDKFFSYYYLSQQVAIADAVRKAGYDPEKVTDHIITHLHFDHVGGTLVLDKEGKVAPSFPNATHWISEPQWEAAHNANPREKASFLESNISPIKDIVELKLINEEKEILPGVAIQFYDGHTDGLMVPMIRVGERVVAYTNDLLPSKFHLPLPWVMAYDIRPLVSMHEKEHFLNVAAQNDFILFLEHDPETEAITVKQSEKGVQLWEENRLSEMLD